jgi:hypothetical protein
MQQSQKNWLHNTVSFQKKLNHFNLIHIYQKADELNKEDLYRISTNKFENAVLGTRNSYVNVKTGTIDDLARRVSKCERDDEFSDIASIPSISFSGEEHHPNNRWTKFQVISNNRINNSISSGSTTELLKQSPYCPLSDSMNTTLNTIGSGYKPYSANTSGTATTVAVTVASSMEGLDKRTPLNIPYFSSFSDKNSNYERAERSPVPANTGITNAAGVTSIAHPTHTVHKLNIVRNGPVSVGAPQINSQPVSRCSDFDSFNNRNGFNGSSFTHVSPDQADVASLAEELFEANVAADGCDYEKNIE